MPYIRWKYFGSIKNNSATRLIRDSKALIILNLSQILLSLIFFLKNNAILSIINVIIKLINM